MAVAVGPRILELSEAAYKEIEDKLLAAGYDFLVMPAKWHGLKMDGFVIMRQRLDEHRPSP